MSEKRKDIKVYKADVAIFGKVWAFQCTQSQMADLYKSWHFSDVKEFRKLESVGGAAKTTPFCIERQSGVWLIWITRPEHLLHEVSHVVYHMLEWYRIDDGDELQALLIPYIYKELKKNVSTRVSS